jgi:hypothetical protein
MENLGLWRRLCGNMRAMEISHSQMSDAMTQASGKFLGVAPYEFHSGIGFQQRLLTSINGDAPSGSFRLAQSVVREQEVIIQEAALPVVLSVCP